MSELNYQGDLEKDIIGTFFIDNKNECISKTILQPKHFLDEKNRRMFMIQKEYYKKNGNVDVFEMLKDYESPNAQQVILEYYNYAAQYTIGTSFFKKNEERLITRWQKETSKQLFEQYQKNEIDFKTLKIKLDEVNQNQFFKNLLDVTVDIEDTTPTNTKEREYTEIEQLDYLTKGIEYGTLNVWSAVTNAGKTTLMTQFIRNFIMNERKVFCFNGEQTAKEFKNNLFVSMCNKKQIQYVRDKNNEKIIDIMPIESMSRYLNSMIQDRLYIYNNDIPKNDIDTMITVMEEAYRKGVRIFFIDNFMQLDNSEMLDQQTRIVEKFKRFARDRNTIVMLVAHPRKLGFGTTRLNIFDISGTQNISNKAANICTIIRKDTMTESEKDFMTKYLLDNDYLIDNCDSIIEVLKTKGNKNGVVGLSYDPELKTFKEVRKLAPEEKGRMDMEALERRKRSK
jgi:replicative DNA helicase